MRRLSSAPPEGPHIAHVSVQPASGSHTPASRRSSHHRQSAQLPDDERHLSIPLSTSSTPLHRPDLLSPNLTSPSPPPAQRSVSQRTAASSIQSNGPSEGEDNESFFVRNTYAQLDISGVKGDGYQEGVERTRARVGGSRASELRARDAVDDGSEKKRDLSPEEVQLLGSLDRYGFFTLPSHDRLVLLTALPFRKPLARVTQDAASGTAQATTVPKIPTPATPPKEQSRIAKWERMLQPQLRDQGGNVEIWALDANKGRKLRDRVYKGIPDRWRSAAWDMLMSKLAKTDQRSMRAMREAYREGLDKPSSFDIQIDLDVPRTISGHVMFRTRYGMG